MSPAAPEQNGRVALPTNPLLAGRFDVRRAIEDGIDPPEELEEGVLLKGAIHHLFAPSESGKTMIALYLVKRRIEAGDRVALFDAENGARTMVERLHLMGVDLDAIEKNLYYFPFPDLTMGANHRSAYEELLDEIAPALVVFDSWASFLSASGFSENDNSEIEHWDTAFTKRTKNRGIASLIIDHVPHDAVRSRGGARKREVADIQWRAKLTIPFNRDSVGQVVLVKEKDREGWMPGSVAFSVGGKDGGIICRPTSGTIEEADPEDGLTPSARKLLDTLRTDFRPSSGATPSKVLPLLGFESRTTYYRAKRVLLGKGLAREAGGQLYPTEDVPPPDGTPRPGGTPDGAHPQADVPSDAGADGTSNTAYPSEESEMYRDVPSVHHRTHGTASEDVPPRPRPLIGRGGGTPPPRAHERAARGVSE